MWTCTRRNCSTISSTCIARFFAALHLQACLFWSFYSAVIIHPKTPVHSLTYRPQSVGFTLEFHLPYYALRSHTEEQEDPRGLRRSGKFIKNRSVPNTNEYLYEAQISFVIVGLDEWVWTAYCCIERHFGSEETIEFYSRRGYGAPSGGAIPTHYPVWNPREYFLFILSLRIQQITKEWTNVVGALEERLQYHVRQTTCRLRGYHALIIHRKTASLAKARGHLPLSTMRNLPAQRITPGQLTSYAFFTML